MTDELVEVMAKAYTGAPFPSKDAKRRMAAALTAIAAHTVPRDEYERVVAALREVFELWAGSEGFIPETAPEGYLLQLVKRMAFTAREALSRKAEQ